MQLILLVFMGLIAGQVHATNNNNGSSSSWSSHPWWKAEGYSWTLKQKLERNRNEWLIRNGEKNTEDDSSGSGVSHQHVHSLEKTKESLALLENLVHPDEELLDELNDRQIIQAVVTSMAQWNLRKLQKMQRRRNDTSHRSRRDEAMVCYNELGCFRDEGPFNYLDLLPAPPEEINTRFFLYTSRNRDTPHTLSYHNATSILGSAYNASLPTKVMVHGFGSSCQRIWAKEMRTALISVGEVNVICVDWENGANLPNYVRAAVNTRLVGRQVALLINAINSLTGSSNSDFHLIGFSLGAHVAGFAGSDLRNLSRITGLDPAGPLFENYDPRARLDSTDADLVDVIHSNGEKIYMGGLGAWAPMGDLDFYPNGGRMQKGCTNLFVGAVSDMIWSSAEENGRSLCNHRRAYKLFTDSVVPGCHFPAFACESYDKLLEGDCFPCLDPERCSSMGYYADRSAGRGIMYLATREEEPFCANQYRVQLQSAVTLQPISTQGKIELILIGANNFNETFTLTKGPDFELVSGGKLVRLIVPHPIFSPPTKVHVVYTAYNGWIYSGLPKWPIEKLHLMDSFGKSVSFCHKGLFLESGKGVTITLHPGECSPPPPPLPPSPPQLNGNSLLNPNSPAFLNRPALETQSLDNELSVLDAMSNSARFRSMDSGNMTGMFDAIEGRSAHRSNATSNIHPYGNVPLSVLQQIPADIKVGGGNGNNKRPSFYQWPLVGASQAANFFFGNSGRPRFKSLGSRRYEPHGQLTPPSLQQLQQQGGINSGSVRDKDPAASSSRRSYFRRNSSAQLQMSPEERQSRQEYYLLRQQQLVLQQQQFNQASRFRQQSNSAATPSQWVLAPPQRHAVANQWRPDALVEAEVTRYNKDSAGNNQQQPPLLRSSMISSEWPTGGNTPVLAHTGSHPSASSSSSISASPVTLTTMTITNTLSAHQRLPDLEVDSEGAFDMSPTENIQTSYGLNEDSTLLEAIEAANLLSVKTPSSNRHMNESILPGNHSSVPVLDLSSSVGSSKDALGGSPNVWPDYPLVSDGSSVLAEEVYPNPEHLGQARDEYWSNKMASRGRQLVGLTPPAAPPSAPAAPAAGLPIQQYPMVVRPSRLLDGTAFDHKPTYIPINPADRQSRQLQAQYYADSIHNKQVDPVIVAITNQQRTN